MFLQASSSVLMASDKINSVMAVVLTIFAGFIVYLVLTNRKVNELEKKQRHENQ